MATRSPRPSRQKRFISVIYILARTGLDFEEIFSDCLIANETLWFNLAYSNGWASGLVHGAKNQQEGQPFIIQYGLQVDENYMTDNDELPEMGGDQSDEGDEEDEDKE